MTALKSVVVTNVLSQVRVVYLNRATSRWWNARRRPDDTATFCGWYWIRQDEEAGPFKTRSSAIRDAYYRFILRRELPSVGYSAEVGVERMEREIAGAKRRAPQTARRGRKP